MGPTPPESRSNWSTGASASRRAVASLVMPYVKNQGVRIHYEVEGQGCPLVLHHGSFGSLNDWRESGYVEALRPNYRLILIDARGHGASTKPHDPDAYRMELRVSDIVAVLDDLGVATAHFMGWSLGGYVGYGIAKFAPAAVLLAGPRRVAAGRQSSCRARRSRTGDAKAARGGHYRSGSTRRMRATRGQNEGAHHGHPSTHRLPSCDL